MEKQTKVNHFDTKREKKIPKAICYTTYIDMFTICTDTVGQHMVDTQATYETTSDEDGSGAYWDVGEFTISGIPCES